jgi:hypothetical protein
MGNRMKEGVEVWKTVQNLIDIYLCYYLCYVQKLGHM